jgi:predicted DNA-binding ribbon-helix-helix protein
LETEFWEALNKISENEKSSIQSLISEIDINRKSSLASSTRVFILQYYKQI